MESLVEEPVVEEPMQIQNNQKMCLFNPRPPEPFTVTPRPLKGYDNIVLELLLCR